MLKGQCDGCLVDFLFCAIYASLLAMNLVKLTVNDKISALCKNIYIYTYQRHPKTVFCENRIFDYLRTAKNSR